MIAAKVPPSDIEYEQKLLACLMQDPNAYHDVSAIITADSFYHLLHQAIFAAITLLVAESKPVEQTSVVHELARVGVNKPAEVQAIAGLLPTGAQAMYYAELVAENTTRRNAIYSCDRAMRAMADKTCDVRDVVATVQRELDQTLPTDHRHKTANVYPEIINVWEQLLEIKSGGELPYIPTGFIDLDSESFLSPGTHTILGADPRVGKTSWVLCVCRHMAKQGKRPVMFTLEMTRARVMQNLIAQEAQVCHKDMIRGRLSAAEESRITRLANVWANYNIGILDGNWSVAKIRHRLVQEQRDNKVDAVFIDALGGLDISGIRSESLNQIFDTLCRSIQEMAIELDIPALTTHHTNRSRSKEEKRPNLYSLNQAGEKFCDNAWLLFREYLIKPTHTDANEAEVIIAKNRDGDVGVVELGWNGPTKTFYNLAKYENTEAPAVMAGAKQWGN
jgi:replicative DNA helicase